MYRLGAALADLAVMAALIMPLIFGLAGGMEEPGPVHGLIAVAVAFIYLVPVTAWKSRSLGLWLVSARIVDIRSGRKPRSWQFVLRFLGILLATAPAALGLLWAGWNRRKRGWHDYLARTAVVGDETFRPLTAEEKTNLADMVDLGDSTMQ